MPNPLRLFLATFMMALPMLAITSCTPTPPLPRPAPASSSSSNGMQVVVIPDHRAPVITHMVWYQASVPPMKCAARRASRIFLSI